jgi:predicted component of type VI protein secretion system
MDATLTKLIKEAVAETVESKFEEVMETMQISVSAGLEKALEDSGTEFNINKFGKRERDQLESLTSLSQKVTDIYDLLKHISTDLQESKKLYTEYHDKKLFLAAQDRLLKTFSYSQTLEQLQKRQNNQTPPSSRDK